MIEPENDIPTYLQQLYDRGFKSVEVISVEPTGFVEGAVQDWTVKIQYSLENNETFKMDYLQRVYK